MNHQKTWVALFLFPDNLHTANLVNVPDKKIYKPLDALWNPELPTLAAFLTKRIRRDRIVLNQIKRGKERALCSVTVPGPDSPNEIGREPKHGHIPVIASEHTLIEPVKL